MVVNPTAKMVRATVAVRNAMGDVVPAKRTAKAIKPETVTIGAENASTLRTSEVVPRSPESRSLVSVVAALGAVGGVIFLIFVCLFLMRINI
jgi:hypothetical protein